MSLRTAGWKRTGMVEPRVSLDRVFGMRDEYRLSTTLARKKLHKFCIHLKPSLHGTPNR